MPGPRSLDELARASIRVLTEEGIDVWLEQFPTPDFVWDVTPMGIGLFEGHAAFREFFEDWTSSYDPWFLEVEEVEEMSPNVGIIALRQGGRLRGSDGSVEFRFAQLGIWEGERLARAVNYPSMDAARTAAKELAASG